VKSADVYWHKVNRDPLLQAFLCRCPAGAGTRGWPDWRADKGRRTDGGCNLVASSGRIGGYYLSDLLRSHNPAGQARFNEAIDAGTAFLKGLQGQPWRRHFIYCCFGFYSWNVEATARNNIGAARMQLGEIERAEADLRHAVAKTRTTRCHTFNLAIIAHVQGQAIKVTIYSRLPLLCGWPR
jgi:hypothetical protein